MGRGELFIGFDIGSTQVKGAIFSDDGAVVEQWRRPYPTRRPAAGLVEQDPDDWLAAMRDALADFASRVDVGRIAAIGLCGQVNTDVFVDAAGRPLAPAITWQDVRAGEEAGRLAGAIGHEEKAAWWGEGVAVPIGSSHVLAKMAWMARNRPDIWARTAHVLSPKDYCLFHLTGVVASDPISAWGQVGEDTRYAAGLLARVPGAAERLPPLRGMTEILGEVRVGNRKVPVVTGTMDAWGSLFGCGVSAPGQGMYMSGTSEILALTGTKRVGAPGVVTFPTIDGLVVHAGPTQSGGDSLRWWSRTANVAPHDIPRLAGTASRTGRAMLFLPHLEGERAPLWDSDIRAAFLGVDSRAEGPDFALAVLEGVALAARLLFDALVSAAGTRPAHLVLGGGGSVSDLWSQIRADCLGVPLRRLAHPDVGCLGAAVLGAVGAGHFASVAAAVPAMSVIDRVFEPDPAMARRYDALFGAFKDATAALRPIGRMLAEPGER